METVDFTNPAWIPYVLTGTVIVLVIGAVWLYRRMHCVRFYGRSGGHIHGQFRAALFVSILLLLGLGLGLLFCGPYAKKQMSRDIYEPVHIVIALDVSKSMLASSTDQICSPSRLDIAIRELQGLITLMERQGLDKVALVVFSRYAYRAIPVPTDDYRLFIERLAIETLRENVLTMPEGTNHWRAVEESCRVFDPEKRNRKMLVILTDGEPDAPEGEIEESMKEAVDSLHRADIDNIYVVGIGQPGVIQMVPLGRMKNGCPDVSKGYMVQTGGIGQGEVMTTATNAASLRGLAKQLGGGYIQAATGLELAKKFDETMAGKRVKLGTRFETVNVDLSEYLIKILLVMMAGLVMLKTP